MEKIFTGIKERVLYFAEFKNVSKEKFFENLGITYGSFKGKAKKTALNSDVLVKLFTDYPELNINWVFFGEGNMIKQKEAGEPECKQTIENLKYINEYLRVDIDRARKEAIDAKGEIEKLKKQLTMLEDKIKKKEPC